MINFSRVEWIKIRVDKLLPVEQISPETIFVNEVLLEPSRAHSLKYYLTT